MTSFLKILHEAIHQRGILTYAEMVSICVEEGHKVSYGEKLLRKPFTSPELIGKIPKKNKRGDDYVYAYQWKGGIIEL